MEINKIKKEMVSISRYLCIHSWQLILYTRYVDGVEGGLSRRIRGMDGYEYDEEVHSVLETFAKRNNDSGDRKLSGLVADALATPGRSCSPIGDYKPAHGYWGAPRVVVRGGAMPIGGLQPAIRGGLLFRRVGSARCYMRVALFHLVYTANHSTRNRLSFFIFFLFFLFI